MAEHCIPSVSELCLSFNHQLLFISGPYPHVSIPSSSPRPDRMWPPGEGLDISIWSCPWLEAAGWGMPSGVSPRLAACKLGFFLVDDRVCSLHLWVRKWVLTVICTYVTGLLGVHGWGAWECSTYLHKVQVLSLKPSGRQARMAHRHDEQRKWRKPEYGEIPQKHR